MASRGMPPCSRCLFGGQARGVQARNRQQSPAEVLVLIGLIGPQITAVIAEIGVDEQVRAEYVAGRNGSVEDVGSPGSGGSVAWADPVPPSNPKI